MPVSIFKRGQNTSSTGLEGVDDYDVDPALVKQMGLTYKGRDANGNRIWEDAQGRQYVAGQLAKRDSGSESESGSGEYGNNGYYRNPGSYGSGQQYGGYGSNPYEGSLTGNTNKYGGITDTSAITAKTTNTSNPFGSNPFAGFGAADMWTDIPLNTKPGKFSRTSIKKDAMNLPCVQDAMRKGQPVILKRSGTVGGKPIDTHEIVFKGNQALHPTPIVVDFSAHLAIDGSLMQGSGAGFTTSCGTTAGSPLKKEVDKPCDCSGSSGGGSGSGGGTGGGSGAGGTGGGSGEGTALGAPGGNTPSMSNVTDPTDKQNVLQNANNSEPFYPPAQWTYDTAQQPQNNYDKARDAYNSGNYDPQYPSAKWTYDTAQQPQKNYNDAKRAYDSGKYKPEKRYPPAKWVLDNSAVLDKSAVTEPRVKKNLYSSEDNTRVKPPVIIPINQQTGINVIKNSDGTYTIVGGNPFKIGITEGDRNLYVVDKYGNRTGEVIGESLTPYSFLDGRKVKIGVNINLESAKARNFIQNKIINADLDLITYIKNARSRQPLDYKTNEIESLWDNEGEYKYRGENISGVAGIKSDFPVIASARDIGNFAAGWVAGNLGLSWVEARAGFDGYEMYSNQRIGVEGPTTQEAEYLGYLAGRKAYLFTHPQYPPK